MKASILKTMEQAKRHQPDQTTSELLEQIGLSERTYRHWRQRAAAGQLQDRVVTPNRQAVLATPQEEVAVLVFARTRPPMGYKRMTYALMAENKVFLRPWMVRDILAEANLLGLRPPAPEPLRRPPEATRPDERWHTDFSMWWFAGRGFWLIDVLDAYSRYLVYCELLVSATADAAQQAAQHALETLTDRPRCEGEPQVVHDGGPQFIGHEWNVFVHGAGLKDIRTKAYHPQSNGRDERIHRTMREEMLITEDMSLYQARGALQAYRHFYNHQRPHGALHYLCPIDYYRGNPDAKLAEREEKTRAATMARKQYWLLHPLKQQAGSIR